jgi:hypothetical protein
VAGLPVLAACREIWDIGDWLGAAHRTGGAWPNEAVIAKLLADVRPAFAAEAVPVVKPRG